MILVFRTAKIFLTIGLRKSLNDRTKRRGGDGMPSGLIYLNRAATTVLKAVLKQEQFTKHDRFIKILSELLN